MNEVVNDLSGKMAGSVAGAAASWGLQDVSFLMAIVASCFSVCLSCLGIAQVVKHWSKK